MVHSLAESMPLVKPRHRRPPPMLARLDNSEYVLPHAPPPAPAPAPPPAPPAPVTSRVQPSGDRFAESAVNNAIPALEQWPGELGFGVTVRTPPAAQHGRQRAYVFDPELPKLYVDIGIGVPFGFTVKEGVEVAGLRVSALPVYPELHHVNTPVRRCPTHRQPGLELNAGAESHIDHVIRAEHDQAVYRQTGSTKERRSVVVPFERPQPGTDDYRVMYKFTCMNTCVGGINRRRLVIQFTLEDCSTGKPLGRQTIEVKVCKCPHRDARTDQTRRRPAERSPPPRPTVKRHLTPSREPSEPGARRPRIGHQFAVLVDDVDLYDHLVAVRDSFLAIRRRARPPRASDDQSTEEPAVEEAPPDIRRRPTLPTVKVELL